MRAAQRGGDPARRVASSEKICRVLGWEPQHSDIESIAGGAWKGHKNRTDGPKAVLFKLRLD